MPANARDQILDAVQAIIVREGVRGARLRQVAQEAGVSLGLLSYHFDDKQTLIQAAFERATRTLLAASQLAANSVIQIQDQPAAFLRGAYAPKFLDGDYLRLRISLWAVALTDPELAKLDASFYDEYLEAFLQLIVSAQPDISLVQARQRASDAIALSNGLWLNWARFRDSEELERGLCLCEEIVFGTHEPSGR